MAKRPPLSEPRPPRKEPAIAATLAPPPPLASPPRANSRAGKLQLTAFIDADMKLQLDVFAARERRTIQSVVDEMCDMFAVRHNLARMLPAKDAA